MVNTATWCSDALFSCTDYCTILNKLLENPIEKTIHKVKDGSNLRWKLESAHLLAKEDVNLNSGRQIIQNLKYNDTILNPHQAYILLI
jgi:hypothetical protein